MNFADGYAAEVAEAQDCRLVFGGDFSKTDKVLFSFRPIPNLAGQRTAMLSGTPAAPK
jgi:hypothetical protein